MFAFQKLFGHLVEFYSDLCIQNPPQLDFADRLLTPLYELTQMSPDNAGGVVNVNLINRQEEFAEICQKRAGRGLYPGLDTVWFLGHVIKLWLKQDTVQNSLTPIFCQYMLKL